MILLCFLDNRKVVYPDTLLERRHLWSRRHQWSLTRVFSVNDGETTVPGVIVPLKYRPLTCASIQINHVPLILWGCLSGVLDLAILLETRIFFFSECEFC